MKFFIFRDVGMNGKYTKEYGIHRMDWWSNDKNGQHTHHALCISFGSRDLIIVGKKKKK